MTHRQHFFRLLVPQFVLALLAIAHLTSNGPSGYLIATFIAWFLCYVMGEGIFYHRYFSHKAFECRPWLAKFFTVCAVLGGFGGPIAFRGVHTGLHHAHTDTLKDPHSPVHGFWHAFLGWHMTSVKFPLVISKSLLADRFYSWVEPRVVYIWWTAAAILALIDWHLLTYTLGLAGMIGTVFSGISNSFGHRYGSRRFETDDLSTNNAWLSWLTWQGGILHNNHHAQPVRYHDSHAWYEFDIAKWIVPLIATNIRQDPEKT